MVPTPATRTIAHVAVGAAVAILTTKVAGRNAALMSAIAGVLAHQAFDAPPRTSALILTSADAARTAGKICDSYTAQAVRGGDHSRPSVPRCSCS